SSRRRHTRFDCDWSSDVCSSDLADGTPKLAFTAARAVTFPIPGNPVTLTLAFDAIAASYSGAAWNFPKVHDSTVGLSLGGGFPRSEERRVGKGGGARWAR